MEKELLEKIIEKLDKVDSRFDKIDSRLDKMDSRFDKMGLKFDKIESRQDEMYQMLVGLEENAKITRAEQDKISYTLADMQNKLNRLVEDVEEHDSVINQIKAIK